MSDKDHTPAAPTSSDAAPHPVRRNFYGRLKGKTMRASQKEYLSEDLGPLTPTGISLEDNPSREQIDLRAHFGNDNPVWLEVGFGGGEHLVHMAAKYRDINILGCEPYMNGVAMLLGKIRRAGVTNLAVYPGDARDLMEVVEGGFFAKAFLNYPDPWPKKRHHRRRFVTQEHLQPLFNVMKSGAEFRIATDIADYVRQAVQEVPKAGFKAQFNVPAEFDFEDAQEVSGDWDHAPEDWISTRYEQKALREGRKPHYLTYLRP
jgi:tRNA (guanine-N7-)-methyltransferase